MQNFTRPDGKYMLSERPAVRLLSFIREHPNETLVNTMAAIRFPLNVKENSYSVRRKTLDVLVGLNLVDVVLEPNSRAKRLRIARPLS
jgi:hypothetical protein